MLSSALVRAHHRRLSGEGPACGEPEVSIQRTPAQRVRQAGAEWEDVASWSDVHRSSGGWRVTAQNWAWTPKIGVGLQKIKRHRSLLKPPVRAKWAQLQSERRTEIRSQKRQTFLSILAIFGLSLFCVEWE